MTEKKTKSFAFDNGQEPKTEHQPVLPEEVLDSLKVPAQGWIVDATVGCGGHASLILESSPGIRLLCLDRDRDALKTAEKKLAPFSNRVILKHGNFADLSRIMSENGIDQTNGFLFDFGVSSLQLDRAERGFSFRRDGPLDMRMDQSEKLTASVLLNTAGEDELTWIFRKYGEQPDSRRIARKIIERRREHPWMRTRELAEMLEKTAVSHRRSGPPPPTRCFQALRIAVNDELKGIEQALDEAIPLLKPEGRIVAISFHSLEDRIVKTSFREAAKDCICPPDFPECRCQKTSLLRILTKRPVRANQSEKEINPRAGSARLRAAEKLAAPSG